MYRDRGYITFEEISVGVKANSRGGKTVTARGARQTNGSCACDALGARKAVGVDPEIKAANRHRLRRIEGQIRGLQKMVEEDRYCAEIITQIASVQEALRGVARNLMRNHLHHCATKALRSGKKEETQAMYDELLELIYAHLR
jgi:DNA-binding FrmR family transcriptional regulator